MDIAVLSDIHGNYVALERCLAYVFENGIKNFVFLGDYIGELAYPERTMERLYDLKRRYPCWFIRGNKEDYWLDYRAGGGTGWQDHNSTTGTMEYIYHCLTAEDMDFFEQLQPVQEITVGEMPPITICHGTPYDIKGKLLLDADKTIEIMGRIKSLVILCGHTHVQGKITYRNQHVFNPGSVGMPLSSQGKTQFMMLHEQDGIWSDEFVSLEYDVERVIRELHEVKLEDHAPYWTMVTEHVLRGGKVSHADVLSRSMTLCKEETGSCVWPEIPEIYWAQAAKELLGR